MASGDHIKIDDVSFEYLIDLEPHGPDTFVGIAPKYPWGRVFGGQVVAQALRSAMFTVEDKYHPHSLHAYFIRGGTHTEPIRFEVDRLRNGRSFVVRNVVARQSGGAILQLSASFHRDEDGAADVSPLDRPDVPAPDSVADTGWGNIVKRRLVHQDGGRLFTWIKLANESQSPHATPTDGGLSDRRLAACALAFSSDTVMTHPQRVIHPEFDPTKDQPDLFVGASLDHTIHFHRPVGAFEWILADVEAKSLMGARGLAAGQLFSADGAHVASVSQETVLRVNSQRG